MSEAPKTVEEPVVAPAATETPAAEPVVETTTAEPAAAEPAATEEAAPVVEEVKPVEEGVLGYKGPGLLKGLIFQKKFVWFGTEAVEQKVLSNYLRGEKPEVGNHNVAWASYTGKGLLFFAKKESEKATPASVINLAEISDVTSEGNTFFFTDAGHKHTFEAKTVAERENWVSQLKVKTAEAKELAATITEQESYKSTLEKLKPTVAPAVPKKSTDVKKEEKTEAAEDKKEETTEPAEEKKEEKLEAPKDEKKTARKSRSASRKRNSIFGSIGFGKKEEKVEAPKEETPAVAPVEEAAATEPAATEPAATEPVATDAAPAVAEPAAPVEEATPVAAETPKPAKKRNSVFGTFKSFSQPKAKKEEAPAVPAKDTAEPEPVSETAPVIPAVESTEPLAETVAPATEAAPVTNGETKAAETPVTKSDKRKSSIPWLTKKEKPTSDDETEKPKSPFARIRATVKGKKAEKPAEAAPEAAAEPAVETEAKPEEPVVSQPVPAAHTATPTVAATA